MSQRNSITPAIGGFVALAAAIGIGRFVYTPILPEMIASLGWAKSEAGLIASSNFLGYLVGAFITTLPTVSAQPRRWLLVMLTVSAASTMGMALDGSIGLLIAMRFIGGVASAFAIVCGSSLVLEGLEGAARSGAASLHFAGVGFGITVSAIAISLSSMAGFSWQGMWIAAGVLALLAVPLIAGLMAPRQASVQVPANGASQPSDTRLLLLVLSYGLFGYGYIIIATFIVSMVRESIELRPMEPWVWIVVGLTAMPSVAVWFRVSSRIGSTNAFALASIVLSLGVLASVEWNSPVGAIASAALLGGTFMGLTALGLVAARTIGGASSTRAIGWMTVSFATGQMIGPSVGGFLFDLTASYRPSAWTAIAALLLAALIARRSAALASARQATT